MNEGQATSQGHYRGIVAEWYDDFLAGEGEDIRLYMSLLLEEGGPVLELACGTGRLTLPLLRAGLEVDGVDISEEMLALCRAKLDAAGLRARLIRQPIEHLDLGREYRCVFVSGGSFQLITAPEDIRSAIAGMYHHLQPGGRLILDLVIGPAPFGGADPDIWHVGRVAHRGDERMVYSNRTESDPFTQVSRLLTRYELFRGTRLVETVLDELHLREYSRGEAELLLGQAGFVIEKVEQRRVMSTHSVSALFVCRKPATDPLA
jgi:SAM-dependent methyltransferase